MQPSATSGESSPPTSPQGDHPADATLLFTEFVRHRDVHCPRCDYSLRNANHPTCPECGEPLRLAIATESGIMGALLATVVPGLGCGICSAIFIALIIAHPGAPGLVVLATFMMFISGVVALAILACRRQFVRQTRQTQRTWAIVSTVVHVILFVLLLLSFN